MQRTLKIKLKPTQKKKIEIVSTMQVYQETVNRFIRMYKKYSYLDILNYKCLYNPKNKDLRIASNYSTNALAYTITLLNKRFNLIRKNCKIRIFNYIKDKEEQHYLFYLLKQPKIIKKIMLRKNFVTEKEFNIINKDNLIKYLHRILKHEFKNNKVPELKKLILRTDIVTVEIEKYKNSKQFSHVLKLSTINKGKRVIVPFNFNKWAQNFFNKIKSCFLICQDECGNINLHIPIEETPKENNNTQEIGIDKGFRKLIVDSKGNKYGEDWNELEKKLDNKFQKKQKQRNKLRSLKIEFYKKWTKTKNKKFYKKIKYLEKFNLGKKKFNKNKIKTKETIKNNVNHTVNQFIFENPKIKIIVLEKLNSFNSNYSKRINRLLNSWKRGYLEKKITFISQLNSIELAYQNPAYTSQQCSNCGYVNFDNRHGESFICIKCGLREDADVNGALNILSRKYDSEIGLYTSYKKVKEILLKRYLDGVIKPPKLEIRNSIKSCENCKSSIQECNIKQTAGGESFNYSIY